MYGKYLPHPTSKNMDPHMNDSAMASMNLVQPSDPGMTGFSQIERMAACCVVEDAESKALAASTLREVVTVKKRLIEKRLSITRKIDAAKEEVMALFRAPVEAYERAEAAYKQKIGAFDLAEKQERERLEREARDDAAAEQRRLDDEARRQREAAEAEARRIQEQADKDAAALREQGRHEEAAHVESDAAAEVQSVAAAAAAPPPVAAVILPAPMPSSKVSGASTQFPWKGVGFDLDATIKAAAAGDPLARSCLCYDASAVSRNAKNLKENFKVPGVRTWQEASVASRR